MSYHFPWIQSSIQICQNWKVSAEEWDAIYLACPPEMRKTLLEANKIACNPFDRIFRAEQKTPEPPARTLRTLLAFFFV